MEIRPFRLLLALTLASVVTAAPIVVVQAVDGREFTRQIVIATGAFCASWLLWLVGTAAFVSSVFRRPEVKCRYFCMLGAVLTMLHWPTSFVAIYHALPFIFPAAVPPKAVDFEIGKTLALGVFEMPFGLFGGWLLWRLGFPSLVTLRASDVPPPRQHWRDLKLRSMLFGLALAPVAPLVPCVLALVAILLGDEEPPSLVAGIAIVVLFSLTVEIWSIATGFVWLRTVTRWRGGIGRRDSMVMGSVSGFLLPIVAMSCGGLLFEPDFFAFVLSENALVALLLGFLGLVAGLLSGWIFWRISIRPAFELTTKVAPVFD